MNASDGGSNMICTANQALRCDSANLVRCSGDGTTEVSESCSLGCNASPLRCKDVDPSNGLAQYLDASASEPDFHLGTTATFNTDNGMVMVDGHSVTMRSALVAQTAAPTILVFMVRSLIAADVTITGNNAFAIVSNGDIQIAGVFTASGNDTISGPGRFNEATCRGAPGDLSVGQAPAGSGGGAFGSAGGRGGSATNINGTAAGGAGGMPTGNSMLIPLRGGCDSGGVGSTAMFGAAGGAMQIVSRTRIAVGGIIAANGSSVIGGGSGGGILLEAPTVEVSGGVVANGGAGAGGALFPPPGENGRLDTLPATGSDPADGHGGKGGNGGAGNTAAGDGVSIDRRDGGMLIIVFGGHGGGGVGRIRVNTIPGGFHRAGGFLSPNPSIGSVATR